MDLYITGRRRLSLPDDLDLSPEDMPIDTALRALDVTSADPHGVVVLKGNEPMLYPEIEQLFASIRKRHLSVLVETTGLMPSLGERLLGVAGVCVMLKVYRPGVVPEDAASERHATVGRLRQSPCKLSLCVVVDDPSADYEFSLRLGESLGAEAILFRFSCRHRAEELGPFLSWYGDRYLSSLGSGVRLLLDCGSMPCGFSDESYGRLAKAGFRMDGCSPHAGVLPDGHVVHCREMLSYPGRLIASFKSEGHVIGYFYEVLNQLQGQWGRVSGCRGCPSRLGGTCVGVSMRRKADLVYGDYVSLCDEFRRDSESPSGLMSEEERKRKLWDLGVLSLTLGKNADAVECLEELRGLHPEDSRVHYLLAGAYWELGRLSDGEEEYKKAARLSEDPLPVLAALHKKLLENGNAIKARLLRVELERLSVSRSRSSSSVRP